MTARATSKPGTGFAGTGFAIIGRLSVTQSWDGSPLVLAQHQSATMPQTTNGSMILAWLNLATMNNLGQLALTTGGSAPEFVSAPALTEQPSVLVRNWQANNLTVSNTSQAIATPIRVQAIGPGIPGIKPVTLPNDGTKLILAPGGNAQGVALPQYMQLAITNNSGNYSVIGVISSAAACLIAVNAPANTGAGSGNTAPAPAGYCATVMGNSYAWNFNWGSSVIFVSNLSAANAQPAVISLFPL